nr:glycosyltransferase [Thalassobacillus sp. C254]
MTNSSLFVISSNYEGISNSMLEALAIGVPVISTDSPIGGAKTYIKNGENGLLTKSRGYGWFYESNV